MPGLDGPIEYKRSHNSYREFQFCCHVSGIFLNPPPILFPPLFGTERCEQFFVLCRNHQPRRIQSTVSRIRLFPLDVIKLLCAVHQK